MSGSVTVNDLTAEDRHKRPTGRSSPGRLARPYRIPGMVENPFTLLGLATH